MPDWESVGSTNRLLAAVYAVYDLRLYTNLDKIATCFGEDATKGSIMNRLSKIKSDIDQMKLVLNSNATKEVQTAGSDDHGKDIVSKPKDKVIKSRAYAGKSNGVINGRVKKSVTRGVRNSAYPGITALIMGTAVVNEGQVGYAGGDSAIVKDGYEDIAAEYEDDDTNESDPANVIEFNPDANDTMSRASPKDSEATATEIVSSNEEEHTAVEEEHVGSEEEDVESEDGGSSGSYSGLAHRYEDYDDIQRQLYGSKVVEEQDEEVEQWDQYGSRN